MHVQCNAYAMQVQLAYHRHLIQKAMRILYVSVSDF